jgi:hypothetical protein
MIAMLFSLMMALTPFAPVQESALPFDIRAKDSLILGKGEKSGELYYDVVITNEAANGVLVKLPYTQKGGKFSFDLHHRVSLTPDYKDAEITTIVEVITGAGTSVGVYTLIDKVTSGGKFEDTVLKTNTAEVDKYVTPLSRKTVTIETVPGPQSLSIVGKSTITTRGNTSTRIDTPGVRIASVSKMKFVVATVGTRLNVDKN